MVIKKKEKKLKIEKITLIPTRLGIIFPRFIRKYVSYVLGEIYKEIDILLKVKK